MAVRTFDEHQEKTSKTMKRQLLMHVATGDSLTQWSAATLFVSTKARGLEL